MGTLVGSKISSQLKPEGISSDTFGHIVQAACLAHDIGNPPFGHSGEHAIGTWFKSPEKSEAIFGHNMKDVERNDLKNFEGNAQGFRILTQLENNHWNGGLQLTHATLATFSKYPRSSKTEAVAADQYVGEKKIGFFESERSYFEKIASQVGLVHRDPQNFRWCRHPLAFLVEAADDICYAIVDIEDGYSLGYLTFDEAKDLLSPIANEDDIPESKAEAEVIGKLRAKAIGRLINSASDVFLENETSLLAGKYTTELLADTPHGADVRKLKRVAKEKIFWSERKTIIEIAGSEIISGLLELFLPVVNDLEDAEWNPEKLSGKSQMLSRLVTCEFIGVTSRYDCWLRVTDFISGMTDRFALDLYRKLKGIAI